MWNEGESCLNFSNILDRTHYVFYNVSKTFKVVLKFYIEWRTETVKLSSIRFFLSTSNVSVRFPVEGLIDDKVCT